MGRGRTTTGMIASSIIASIEDAEDLDDIIGETDDSDQDITEERAFLNG